MRHWQITSLSLALLVLTGCGGMSASECELADWESVGYADGARGRTVEAFDQRRQSCARHDVAPDFKAYQSGRDAGLTEYCQPAKAYRLGAQGGAYYGVCPGALGARFYDSYLEGRLLFDLESAVNRSTRQIAANQARMDALEIQLAENIAAQFSDMVTPEQRAILLIETRQLAEERVTLADEVDRLEVQLEQQRQELEDYRQEMVAKR